MRKQIIFDKEVREKIQAGVNKLANAVGATLGPKGRNVILGRNQPIVTKDGVTVAKEIELTDEFENIGAQLVKEVASKTNDIAGDGTTTATVLAQAIYNEGLKMIAAGYNPVTLKDGIDRAVVKALNCLKGLARPVTLEGDEIERIASISANDPALGKIIADLFKEVGKDGIITVEDGDTAEIEKELVHGMRIDKGFFSPYMVTNPEKMTADLKDVYVLITDKRVESISDVLPIMEKVAEQGEKKLVIVAEDIGAEALSTLILNKLNGVFNTVAIKAPKFGQLKKDILNDLAVVTGGKFISSELGIKLENVELSDLGRVKHLIATKESTTFVDGAGDAEKVKQHAELIKEELKTIKEPFESAMKMERFARLTGGIAVLKVGATTDTARKEKRQRIEDSVNATRAALEEGIVPGGGVALYQAYLSAGGNIRVNDVGERILVEALLAPMKKIAMNAGKDSSTIIERLSSYFNRSDIQFVGYNAATDEYVDMIRAGILDPVKVTRTALEKAASIAGLLLTTEAMVADDKDYEQN